jgi:hypothetical protein
MVFSEKYTSDLSSGVKNWWPFANLYRKWFASTIFLWLTRFAITSMLLTLLFLLSIVLPGIIGLFPSLILYQQMPTEIV